MRASVPRPAKLQELVPADQSAEALARYASGEAPGAIAVVFDVPRGRVYRFLSECGALRSRSEAAKLRHVKRRELEQAGDSWSG